ncbi:MAG: hypothetical protein H7328_05005 [Bdellovibrio sp.]|nr:hypothetical protein [Bdellovibrio sp.]
MKFFIKTKQFFFLSLVIVIQQAMVAGSTYFLIKLTSSQHEQRGFLIQLFGFLSCLTLVYFPVSLQKYLQDKWVLSIQKKYLGLFRKNYQGRIDLLGNSVAQNEKFGFMQRESFHVIDQVTFYWNDLLTTALNVVFNIAVIGATLDKSFIGAYTGSFAIYGFFAYVFAKPLGMWSAATQASRVAHSSILSKSWNTLLIGNQMNIESLYKLEGDCFSELSSRVLKNRSKTESVQLLITLVTMVPVMGLLIYLIIQGLQNPVVLFPLIATLHRQVQIIQHIEVMGTLGLHYHSMSALLNGFFSSMQTPEKQTLDQRMKQEHLQFIHSNGRTLVTGPNGAGKSTWLKIKKQQLGDQAVYVPANMEIFFEQISDEMSTGQKAMAILKHIEAENSKDRVFLFDEWDANLDNINREIFSAVIQNIAKTNLVYEVRHNEYGLR